MKKIYFLLFILCNTVKLFAQQNINKQEKTYTYVTNQKITQTDTTGSLTVVISAGNFNVFTYTFKHQEEEAIADDEMIEKVVFEVDKTWKNFTFKNKLNLAQAIYTQQCYCTGRGNHHVTSGIIKGKKQRNGNFMIEAKLTITFENKVTKEIRFKGIFKRVD